MRWLSLAPSLPAAHVLVLLMCSGISTSFPPPDFPPNEVHPTDETHFQVASTPAISPPRLSNDDAIQGECEETGSCVAAAAATRGSPIGVDMPCCWLRAQVTWTIGATAPGSSGSPLIDTSSNKVVGVLTGGYTNCHDRTQSDYYGRLSVVRSSA
jgi:hypothetical protein